MVEALTVTAALERRNGGPSLPRLFAGQIVYQHRVFWRNSRAAFSSFLLPLILLLVFDTLQGGKRIGDLPAMQVVTPGIVVFAVMAACYQNLATALVAARDRGLLKRLRGTPLPMGVYLAGRVAFTAGIAALSTVVVVALGALLFGVQVVVPTLPGAIVTLSLGAAAFCALGFAVSTLIPNAEAAPAILGATLIPLALVSGVFFPAGAVSTLPGWVQTVVRILPAEPFAEALQHAFSPHALGPGLEARPLATLAAWLAGASAVAIKRFRWDPTAERRAASSPAAKGGEEAHGVPGG